MGLPKGPTRGQWIHGEAESALKTAEIKKLLLDSGIQELHVEQAFLGKRDIRFLESGASKIDVLEKLDDNTVCIYDYKTGGARFPDPTREKYLRAAVARFGVTTVYVMPVYVP
jgi:hypothetical protein